MPHSGHAEVDASLSQTGRLIVTPWSADIHSVDRDEIRVVVVPLENAPTQFNELLEVLIDEERERADRFRVEKPRVQFVITRGLLRLTLGKILGIAPRNVPIGYAGAGKPVLENNFSDLHFNVTHTDGLALIALARRAIGIDVERVRPMANQEGLVVRFFSRVEQEAYLSLEPAKQSAGFFRGWTCKEALIKAVGLSVAYLDTFDVELNPDKEARLLAARNPGLMGMKWSLTAVEPADGYAAAVAVGFQEVVQVTAVESRRPT